MCYNITVVLLIITNITMVKVYSYKYNYTKGLNASNIKRIWTFLYVFMVDYQTPNSIFYIILIIIDVFFPLSFLSSCQ